MQYLTADFETNKFDMFFVRWNFNLLELLLLVRLMVEQLRCHLCVLCGRSGAGLHWHRLPV